MIEICLGIVLVAFLPVLPSIWLLLVVVSISLILWLYFPCNKFILRLVCLLMAIAYASLWGYWNLAHRLASADSPLDAQVSGVVVGLPKVASKSVRFQFSVEELMLEDGSSAERYPALRNLQLTWYNPTHAIEPGQRWQFSVRLKSPGSLSNPGGFDYAGWLFRQQIDARGYVRDNNIPQQSPATEVAIDQMRFKLIALLNQAGLADSSVATLRALILGDKSALTASQWQLLKSSGRFT
ncbi:MAG: ComEC/Rec2 family competence protein [Amphritea sp.]